jgi:hypothetical protein
MKVNMNNRMVMIEVNMEELTVINNSLNEVCNGLPLNDFENRIGVSHDVALELLKKIQLLFEK